MLGVTGKGSPVEHKLSCYASLITGGTGEPKSIEDLRVFRLGVGFWRHINIVLLLNLRFYTHRFRRYEQYR